MLSSKLLRMKDLTCVGIKSWPTLKLRILNDNFPPGRYLGGNTRVWTIEEVEAWFESRPKAGPPPEIHEPATLAANEGDGRSAELSSEEELPRLRDSSVGAQAPLRRRGT